MTATITLYVALPKRGRAVLIVPRDDTVNSLKLLLVERTGLPPQEQTLFFKDTVLDDDVALSSYKLENGYTLRLRRGRLCPEPPLRPLQEAPKFPRGVRRWRVVAIGVQWIVRVWRLACLRQGHVRLDLPGQPTVEMGYARDVSLETQVAMTAAVNSVLLKAPHERDLSDAATIQQWLLCLSKCAPYLIADCIATYDLMPAMELKVYAAGDCIFHQDDVGDRVFIVLHGAVTVAVHKFGCLGRFGTGFVFGDGETPSLAADGSLRRTITVLADYGALMTQVIVLRPTPAVAALVHQLHNMQRVKLNYLYTVAYFRDFPRASMARLAYNCSYVSYQTKTLLVAQGDTISALLLLVAGSITTITHSAHSNTKVLDILEAPQLCGEEYCAGERGSSLTVLAMPGAVVMVMPLPLVDMMALYQPMDMSRPYGGLCPSPRMRRLHTLDRVQDVLYRGTREAKKRSENAFPSTHKPVSMPFLNA
ncbi:hypothetical protein ACHHYP_01080 [Achlya hypogyna]|uniref:Ubiquitin-like domain-containing protein n=1 Tax=Achlya hypogyna TaxID=1202772 RepID=A0A1V9ZTQ7_ACHHY|nr:hypothetical protein ACHHYP_01080 [Achlya hypogyna]